MREMLQDVVMAPQGTGWRAKVPGITVAGKTGSAQVVNLKRNRSRQTSTVPMMWQEHALFAAFAPVEDPEIALAIVSEHDQHGGGGSSAAPIARQIIEAWMQLKEQQKEQKTSALKLSRRDLRVSPSP